MSYNNTRSTHTHTHTHTHKQFESKMYDSTQKCLIRQKMPGSTQKCPTLHASVAIVKYSSPTLIEIILQCTWQYNFGTTPWDPLYITPSMPYFIVLGPKWLVTMYPLRVRHMGPPCRIVGIVCIYMASYSVSELQILKCKFYTSLFFKSGLGELNNRELKALHWLLDVQV